MLIKLKNIYFDNLKSYKSDILLNKKLLNNSPSNMYEIIFDCENFDKIINVVLNTLKKETKDCFDVYVKNLWGYVQEIKNPSVIQFDKNFKNQVSVSPKYSFIYGVNSFNTDFNLETNDGVVEKIKINDGDLLIFDNNFYRGDESDNLNRIFLIGSILPVEDNTKTIKKGII